jgi:hypothetical protein
MKPPKSGDRINRIEKTDEQDSKCEPAFNVTQPMAFRIKS